MWIFQLGTLALLSLLLVKATDILIVHLRAITKKTSVGGFFIASLLVGLGTSLPELFVGITSALEKVPTLSLGNVLGANIANVTLIAGFAAVIGGSIHINHHAKRNDFLLAIAAAVTPMLLIVDRTLSRTDGILLLIMFFLYNYLIAHHKKQVFDEHEENTVVRIMRTLRHNHTERDMAYVIVATATILFSADLIVRVGKLLAFAWGLPILMVGLFVLALGTSLPELVFDIKAVRRKEAQMFMGNVFGSIVANSTIVLGIASIIHPISISSTAEYGIAAAFFFIAYGLFTWFVRSKHTLTRREGVGLIVVYLLFFLLEMM